MRPHLIKRVLLLFWALWLGLVTASNICDFLKTLGVLDESWPFASGNFKMVTDSTARYGVCDTINRILFAGVIAWEGLAALLLAHAALTFRARANLPAVRRALGVSLPLWGAFMLADEIVFTFKFEETHMRIFIAQLATWLAIELIPDGSGEEP